MHRINLTISSELHEALKAYAEFLNKPAATVAGDLLRDMQPAMEQVAQAMRKAKRADKNGRKTLLELRQIAIQELTKAESDISACYEEQKELFKDENQEELK